jgi:DNA repair exonuclease SbcCD ATPase subunit
MSYTNYNGDDTIDSRELAELLTEMATDRAALVDAVDEADTEDDKEAAQENLDAWDDEHGEEYKALEEFCNEAEQYCSDWHHGVQLILDEHWTEYAEQLTDDLGAIPRNMPTYVVIDWEATADNLKADYTAVEWGAYTYWVR